MSSAFYKSIIEDEMQVFGIEKDSLKVAAVSVGKTYSSSTLTKENTLLDYNNPSYRCAYLYRYASIHTGLVTKCFRKLLKKKEVNSVLYKKQKMKICCLGGGSGTDVVGLFKALAIIPHYHNKVVDVTVLDICGGWKNSFSQIVSNLVAGKVKGVSNTFVNVRRFRFKLIEVDLLDKLPTNVETIISKADIVCVKYASATLGSSISALEVIGEKLMIGTILLFIDHFQENVFTPLTVIGGHIGLKIVVGTLHEKYKHISEFNKKPTTTEKEMFGCVPLLATEVTVLGFVKSNKSIKRDLSSKTVSDVNGVETEDDDDGWDTDNELEETPVRQATENVTKLFCDKWTQTYEKFFQTQSENTSASAGTRVGPDQSKALGSLIDSLSDLMNMLCEWQEKSRMKGHCCRCYQHEF